MPTHEQAQNQMAHKRVIVTFLLAQTVNGHSKLCGHNIPYCQVSHLTFVCTNRALGSKCIELYDGYDLPAYKKVELYREKAELWFTKAPHLLVTHGKYPSRNGPSHSSGRCASCFKSNYLGAEWALPGKKVPFSISIFATKVQLSNLTLTTEDLASKKQLRISLSTRYC